MKKRIFVMFLAVLMGSQPVLPVLAESMEEVTEESSSLISEIVEEENETERERTEEEKLIEKMCDTDILETAFIGKSFWNDEENFEDIKEYCNDIICYYSDNDPYVKFEVEKSFADAEISPLGQTALSNLKAVFEEYNDAIEPDEQLAIIAKLIGDVIR